MIAEKLELLFKNRVVDCDYFTVSDHVFIEAF